MVGLALCLLIGIAAILRVFGRLAPSARGEELPNKTGLGTVVDAVAGASRLDKMKEMLKKISRLPKSLKIVVWINIILVAVELVETAFMAAQGHFDDLMTTILSIVLTILIIGGIFQRSRFVRMLVLILTWLGVGLLGFGLVAGLLTMGFPALVILFPLIIYGVTIWGLTTRQAKRYFRI